MDKIRQAMLARLSDEDREALRAVYAPVIVGAPPQNACKYLCAAPDGEIRVKQSSGWGVLRHKAEFEDLARIARQTGKSIAEVLNTIPETK